MSHAGRCWRARRPHARRMRDRPAWSGRKRQWHLCVGMLPVRRRRQDRRMRPADHRGDHETAHAWHGRHRRGCAGHRRSGGGVYCRESTHPRRSTQHRRRGARSSWWWWRPHCRYRCLHHGTARGRRQHARRGGPQRPRARGVVWRVLHTRRYHRALCCGWRQCLVSPDTLHRPVPRACPRPPSRPPCWHRTRQWHGTYGHHHGHYRARQMHCAHARWPDLR